MHEIFSNAKIQVIKLKSSIDIKEVDDLRAYFTKINESKQYCMDYLDDKDEEKLTQLEKTSKELLNKWMDRVLKSLSQLIDGRQFEDVEERIEAIQTMSSLLGTLGGKHDQFNGLETKLQEMCKDFNVHLSIRSPYNLFQFRHKSSVK